MEPRDDAAGAAAGKRGRQREAEFVDEPGLGECAEQPWSAFAQHSPETARGQLVESGEEVDLVAAGDDDIRDIL